MPQLLYLRKLCLLKQVLLHVGISMLVCDAKQHHAGKPQKIHHHNKRVNSHTIRHNKHRFDIPMPANFKSHRVVFTTTPALDHHLTLKLRIQNAASGTNTLSNIVNSYHGDEVAGNQDDYEGLITSQQKSRRLHPHKEIIKMVCLYTAMHFQCQYNLTKYWVDTK